MSASSHDLPSDQLAPRPWWTFAAVASAVFLSTIDGSIVNIALPTLAREFDAPLAVVQWVVLGYLLTQATLALMIGRLGDMIGKKLIFTAGFGVFTLFSVLAGLSPGVYVLVGMRVLQAVGGAMVIALGIAIITEAFPSTRRGQVLGLIGAVVSVGIVTGPTLGGIILDALSWRWIFFVNLPVGIAGTLLAWRHVPESRPVPGQRFDFGGAGLFLVALLSLLLALSFGQEVGFGTWWILLLLAASAVGSWLFVHQERRADQPMLDLAMFRNVDFSIGVLTGFLSFVTLGGLFLIGPFYLTETLAQDPRTVGLVIASGPLLVAVTSPVAGRLSDQVGSRPVTVAGLTIVVAGFALLLRIGPETGVATMIAGLVPIGAGMGVFQSPNNSAVMGSVRRERLGVAGSILTLNRIVGQTVGIAVLTALWAVRVDTRLAALAPTQPRAVAEAGAIRDFALTAAIIAFVALSLALWAYFRHRVTAHATAVAR